MTGFAILGIDHVVLRCRDPDRMLDFYRGVLGCTVAKRNDRLGLVHLRAGQAMIDLVAVDGELGRAGGAPPATEGRNMDHVCLRIEPFDTTTLRERFSTLGILAGEPGIRFGAEGDGPSIYVLDPEGNRVELKGPGVAPDPQPGLP